MADAEIAPEATSGSEIPAGTSESDLEVPADLDLGDEVGDALAPDGAEAVTEDPASDDPYAAYGGKEAVEAAIKLHEATRSQDGITQLFIEAGQALGLGVREMEALFSQGKAGEVIAAAADADNSEDDDRFLTVKELRELEAKRASEAQATQAQQALEAQTSAAKVTVASTFESLGIDPQDPVADLILKLGDKYLKNLDAESVASAVRQGHAEFLALVDKQAKAYLAKKREQAAKVPSSPSGAGAPAAPPVAPPKNAAEASKRLREQHPEWFGLKSR